ncbi:MAG: hypothetical protein M1335_04470 [Chloroflexi bacterium]|nr:hypothetical protein [Chloroflexota bacterium]
MKRAYIRDVFLLFIVSRILIFGLGELSYNVFPKYDKPPRYQTVKARPGYSDVLMLPIRPTEFTYFSVDHWNRFDSLWYEDIATNGYNKMPIRVRHYQANWNFFPLYPLILKALSLILPMRISGMIISNVFLYASLAILYRFIEKRYSPQIAERTIFYTLIAPASFYFSVVYSESLFLLLIVLGFYLAYEKRFLWASVVTALATITRIPGFLLFFVVAWEYLEARGVSVRKPTLGDLKKLEWTVVGSMALTPVPLFIFLYHLKQLTGDFLAPFHEQMLWGRIMTFPLWPIIRYVLDPYFVQVSGWDLGIFSFTVTVIALGSLIVGWKMVDKVMLLFAFGLLLLPLMSANIYFAGMVRYCLVVFPLYIVWAQWGEKNHIFSQALTMYLLGSSTFYLIAFMTNFRFVA